MKAVFRICGVGYLCAIVLLSTSCGSKKKVVREYEADGIYPVERAEKPVKRPSKKGEDGLRSRIVAAARGWVGVPYRYGGESRDGVDCSGMVMCVYRDVAGIKLPRNSAKQGEYCISIKKTELQPGDLVFFTSRKGKNINHVGIYVGNGCFVHASTSRGVIVSDLDQDYYVRTYHSSGRVGGLGKESVEPEPEGREPRYEVVDHLPGSGGKK